MRSWIHEIAAVILVVVANPGHCVRQAFFVTSFRHQVKKVIRADKDVEPTRIRGIRVVDLTVAVFEEALAPGRSSLGNCMTV